MIKNNYNSDKDIKQRLTAFVDPVVVQRAKVRGALEGLTISEVVEKALDVYAPVIEKQSGQHINIKFPDYPVVKSLIRDGDKKSKILIPKHTKSLTVPR